MTTRATARFESATLAATLTLWACTALAVPAAAQDLAAERSRVLTVIGQVEEVTLPLYPLEPGLGLVRVQDVDEPSALSLRLHFTVEDAAKDGASWGVQIRDAGGEIVWTTWAGGVTGPDFWSDEIAGDRVKVEVYSARPSNPLRLKIDRVAFRQRPITPVSITDPNQLQPIVGQAGWIVDQGRSVARVRFAGDDGKLYVCTSFLVTPDLMLTNQHCISSETEMTSAQIDFDYDRETATPDTLHLRGLPQTDVELDYALIRLESEVDRPLLRLDLGPPPDGDQLLVIQHPAGEPKQISLADCTVDGVVVAGRLGTPTDFGHQCDTKGGSSGSPVLRFSTRTVVGLHHLGIADGSSELFNRAVHIHRVMTDLDPELRAEIEAAQGGE